MSSDLAVDEQAFLKNAEAAIAAESGEAEPLEEVVEPASDGEVGDEDAHEVDRARAAGWKPLDEYKGPPGKWKDYKEFNAVGDKITRTLQSKIATQEATIKKLIESQAVIIEQAKAQALAELNAQKREAIREGDVVAVDELDKKIAAVTETHEKAKIPADTQPAVDPVSEEFVAANSAWFGKDRQMTDFAMMSEVLERRMDPDADQATILERVKAQVVQRFPTKFPGAQRKSARPAAVESGSVAPRAAEVSFAGYPEEVRKLADFFERTGAMSKKDYLAALKRDGVTK